MPIYGDEFAKILSEYDEDWEIDNKEIPSKAENYKMQGKCKYECHMCDFHVWICNIQLLGISQRTYQLVVNTYRQNCGNCNKMVKPRKKR
jgi:hypothetical protein